MHHKIFHTIPGPSRFQAQTPAAPLTSKYFAKVEMCIVEGVQSKVHKLFTSHHKND